MEALEIEYKDMLKWYQKTGKIYGIEIPLDADVTLTKCFDKDGIEIKCNICGRKDFLSARIFIDSKHIPEVVVSHKCIKGRIEQKDDLTK
jgi:hypothetical protein